MKDAQFDDLKQFIDSRISQSESGLEQRLTSKMDGLASKEDLARVERNIRRDMRNGFDGVADAIETVNERIDKLEHVA